MTTYEWTRINDAITSLIPTHLWPIYTAPIFSLDETLDPFHQVFKIPIL